MSFCKDQVLEANNELRNSIDDDLEDELADEIENENSEGYGSSDDNSVSGSVVKTLNPDRFKM